MTEWADLIDSVRLDEVLSALGIRVDQITKGEHWSSCPLSTHPGADASPSFSINEDSLVYNCFICGGGLLPKLVQDVESLDSWDDAIVWLFDYSDGDVTTDDGFQKQLERYLERAVSRPKRTRAKELPFYSPRVIDRYPEAPVELLSKWNIFEQETVSHHQIKYVEQHHRQSPKGEYTGPALIIPHFFGGKLVGYQERWLDDDRGKYPPKYTNSDDFPKAETLYGWDDALAEIRETPSAVLVVESAMTRLRLWELGFTSVGTFGAQVSDDQIRLLRSLTTGVILATDNDPDFYDAKGKLVTGAGKKALAKLANELTDFIPVEALPPVAKEKGDLADIDEVEVLDLYERRYPIFSELATPKSRKARA